MEQASEKLWSLLRAPEGPLVPHIDAFANELNRQGFRRRAIAAQIRLVAKFSHWLKANHIRLENVSDEGAERFLRRSNRRRSIACGSFAALRRLMAFLRQSGVLSEQSSVVE